MALYQFLYMWEKVLSIHYLWGQCQSFRSCKIRPYSANDPNIKFLTHGPTLKFLHGDENSCIVCLLSLELYEFSDIYALNYVYQRLKDVREIQTIYRMVYLWTWCLVIITWKDNEHWNIKQLFGKVVSLIWSKNTPRYQFYAIFRTHWVPPIIA